LTPISPEVIAQQATINIGTVGHVAHGKSTLVRALTGIRTARFKNEQKKNQTIKLGYANAKIFQCSKCPEPECYKAYASSKQNESPCPHCYSPMKLVRHISFVDCPHDIWMATMLNGAAVMDGALLMIAGNEHCPQPQTSEHLAAIEIMKLKHIIVLQNKIDLINHSAAKQHFEEIHNFIQGTIAQGSHVIPISAQYKYNTDVICKYIIHEIPIPQRELKVNAQMTLIRSFDVNQPGIDVSNAVGGIVGGSIIQGVLEVGTEIEIRPGIVNKKSSVEMECSPIFSQIVSLYAEENSLNFAFPGGLIGVGTHVDPALTRQDRLAGQVLGQAGSLPDVFISLKISFFLLRRLLGTKIENGQKQSKVDKLAEHEILMLNIGSSCTGGRVISIKADKAKLQLTSPVRAKFGDKVAISRRVEKLWRLIGWGIIESGNVRAL